MAMFAFDHGDKMDDRTDIAEVIFAVLILLALYWYMKWTYNP